MGTLVVPSFVTPTVRALSDVATKRGLEVRPVVGVDDLNGLPARGRLHLFGGPLLVERVQERSRLAVLEPDDDWLANLPERFVARRVRLMSALDAYGLTEPSFVKMPREKGMEPGTYHGHDLPSLPEDEPLLVSDVVSMRDEYRFWILDGVVHTSSSYKIGGRPEARPLTPAEAHSVGPFLHDLMTDQAERLPSAVVIDVAWIDRPETGWAVVEANMAWFSAHYAADPDRVLDVVMRSSGPPVDVLPRDARFARLRGSEPAGRHRRGRGW